MTSLDEPASDPVIKKPDDPQLVRKLRAKLAEYIQREKQETSGEGLPKSALYLPPEARSQSTRYKIAVLDLLLETGEVDTYELSRRIAAQEGYVDTYDFDNACGVIESYCHKGGEGIVGGTGLPDPGEAEADIEATFDEQKDH